MADLRTSVEWANSEGRRWAFSDRNAGARYANFYCTLDDLGNVNWDAVANNNFRESTVRDGKQAEFLMHESFPWTLIERIGVNNAAILAQAQQVLEGSGHQPTLALEPTWYY